MTENPKICTFSVSNTPDLVDQDLPVVSSEPSRIFKR